MNNNRPFTLHSSVDSPLHPIFYQTVDYHVNSLPTPLSNSNATSTVIDWKFTCLVQYRLLVALVV
jgi:hypothetical protein